MCTSNVEVRLDKSSEEGGEGGGRGSDGRLGADK